MSFAYSPEKERLLEPLIRKFNDARREVAGRPVFVEGQVVSGPFTYRHPRSVAVREQGLPAGIHVRP